MVKSQLATKQKTRSTCNLEVFTEVAKELGLTLPIVKEIFNTHSAFTKYVMESNTFDGVRWPYLGVFRSKPKEVQILNHLKGLTLDQQKLFKEQVRMGKFKALREAKIKKASESTERSEWMDFEVFRQDKDFMDSLQ